MRLVETLMSDPVTDVIVATGGTAMVRAAYRSGNPALGVGPGNVPVLVDATADIAAAARPIADSKAFDNSVLCTNESVLIVAGERARAAAARDAAAAAPCCSTRPARDRLRAYLFPDGMLNGEAIGKDASWIADQAGLRVPPRTRLLLAPVELVVPEEPFCREKLCPVLGVVTVPSADRGIEAARAVIRIGGAGHSAAIHSRTRGSCRYGARVPVLRVAVNAGNSTGSSGLDTNLAPSMTLGTGFVGRSSIGENLEPQAPGQLDPGRLQRRPGGPVRRLRRHRRLARRRARCLPTRARRTSTDRAEQDQPDQVHQQNSTYC